MFSKLLRQYRGRFAEPTFVHRRSFSGAHYYRCSETAADYGMIPAGFGGYLISRDGELVGKVASHIQGSELIRADARQVLRSHHLLAA